MEMVLKLSDTTAVCLPLLVCGYPTQTVKMLLDPETRPYDPMRTREEDIVDNIKYARNKQEALRRACPSPRASV